MNKDKIHELVAKKLGHLKSSNFHRYNQIQWVLEEILMPSSKYYYVK